MREATIEVRNQDAAVFRHRLRERRDELVAPVKYNALDGITASVAWWTDAAKRLNAEYQSGDEARRKAVA